MTAPPTAANAIPGVRITPLRRFFDERGWLSEIFREDETQPGPRPVMAYVSMTRPGVARGPHEHLRQTDIFCFPGPGDFELWLWDNRPASPAFGRREKVLCGRGNPLLAVIPPGVVHAYRNVSEEEGMVINCPDTLYRGPGKTEPVDEARYEDDPASPFRMDGP